MQPAISPGFVPQHLRDLSTPTVLATKAVSEEATHAKRSASPVCIGTPPPQEVVAMWKAQALLSTERCQHWEPGGYDYGAQRCGFPTRLRAVIIPTYVPSVDQA